MTPRSVCICSQRPALRVFLFPCPSRLLTFQLLRLCYKLSQNLSPADSFCGFRTWRGPGGTAVPAPACLGPLGRLEGWGDMTRGVASSGCSFLRCDVTSTTTVPGAWRLHGMATSGRVALPRGVWAPREKVPANKVEAAPLCYPLSWAEQPQAHSGSRGGYGPLPLVGTLSHNLRVMTYLRKKYLGSTAT